MPIPDYQTFMLPMLKLFAAGKTNVRECLPELQTHFAISDEEAQELLPTGKSTRLYNRAHWARVYMGKAGLLHSPRRNFHQITPKGRVLLAQNPTSIDNETLSDFADFVEWKETSRTPVDQAVAPNHLTEDRTPDDAIETAYSTLLGALRDDLLEAMLQISPAKFERLILDLLSAMGYGGGDIQRAQMTRATGDGGIDGVINEDALGLDAVYIQAKRYQPDNKIGRPAIQQFIGSLNGEGANKGVFVTTSDFSREAIDYVSRVQQRVVLLNGARLAELMILHNVGIRLGKTYTLKTLDDDYFEE
ncbi:restriction endonuclease [Thioclava sp. GXIMD2076]|uniref:restriction endonuclease n=1 Tax=unclassified Thioclava TaxID=2621713 RepID=UPI0030D06683